MTDRSRVLYDKIVIIANPVSRRRGFNKAAALYRHLARIFGANSLHMVVTESAGQASTLAYKEAKLYRRPLIIAVGGDGSYHEVIAGVLRAKAEVSNQPIVAVYKAGNANDHYHSLWGDRTVKAFCRRVTAGELRALGLIKVEVTPPGRTTKVHYAHSYTGPGEEANVALQLIPQLKRSRLHLLTNPVKEVWLIIKSLVRHRPYLVEINQRPQRISTLSIHQIGRMAKAIRFPGCHPNQTGLRILTITASWRPLALQRLRLLLVTIWGALRGFHNLAEADSLTLKALEPLPLQFDGEAIELPPGTIVRFSQAPSALMTLAYETAPDQIVGGFLLLPEGYDLKLFRAVIWLGRAATTRVINH